MARSKKKLHRKGPYLLPYFSLRGHRSMDIPVKRQRCNCCWAITSAAVVSHELKECDPELLDFEASVQELIDRCPSQIFLCHGDGPDPRGCFSVGPDDALRYVRQHGITLDSHYQLVYRRQGNVQPPELPRIRIERLIMLEDDIKLQEIKRILRLGPIIGRVSVQDSFIHFRGTGIYRARDNEATVGLHSVLIIGYGQDRNRTPYFHIRNSWGVNWGNHGYAKVGVNFVKPVCIVENARLEEG